MIFLKNKMHIYIFSSVQCVLWGKQSKLLIYFYLIACAQQLLPPKVWLCCCPSAVLFCISWLSPVSQVTQAHVVLLPSEHRRPELEDLPVTCSSPTWERERFPGYLQPNNKPRLVIWTCVCLEKLNACNLGQYGPNVLISRTSWKQIGATGGSFLPTAFLHIQDVPK